MLLILKNKLLQLMCMTWLTYFMAVRYGPCLSYEQHLVTVCPRITGLQSQFLNIKNDTCCIELESFDSNTHQPIQYCFPSQQRSIWITNSWLPKIGLMMVLWTSLCLVIWFNSKLNEWYHLPNNEFGWAFVMILEWFCVSVVLQVPITHQLDLSICH